jgi:hypothetical protein
MKTTETAPATPVTECLATATTAATKALGTDAENRSVTASTNLTVAVTEAGVTKTNKVNASVSLGVENTETPAAGA